MSSVFRTVNDLLAFLLELAALAALCYGGFVIGGGTAVKLILAIGAPLLAAAIWGLFAAPRARVKLPLAGVLVVKALVFACATAALYAAGRDLLATLFAILVVANTTVVTVMRRSGPSEYRDSEGRRGSPPV